MAVRDVILKLAPAKTAASMEAESREWFAICGDCGHARSIWELGGLRYKAKGNPRRRMKCPACGQSGWHRVERRPVGSPAS